MFVDSSPSHVRQGQQSHFNNKENSDVIFKLERDNQTLYADSSLLSSKSEYFSAMFRCQMKESIEGVVSIPNSF